MSQPITGVFPWVSYPYIYNNSGGNVTLALRWHSWHWSCLYPPASGSDYAFRIDWGDGAVQDFYMEYTDLTHFYTEEGCMRTDYYYSLHGRTFLSPRTLPMKVYQKDVYYDKYQGQVIGPWQLIWSSEVYVYVGGPHEDEWNLGHWLLDFPDWPALIPIDRNIQVGDQVLVYQELDNGSRYLIKPGPCAVGDRVAFVEAAGHDNKGIRVVMPCRF